MGPGCMSATTRPRDSDTSMKTFEWSALTYRVFAIGNVLVVLIGLLFLLPTAWSPRFGAVENVPTSSHFATSFWAMASTNLYFLALLVVGGVHLFRLRPSGVTISDSSSPSDLMFLNYCNLEGLTMSRMPPRKGRVVTEYPYALGRK